MPALPARFRLAGLTALAVSLVMVGGVAGAAGSALILGQSNSAGASNTTLTANTNGTAFLVEQQGTGTALRGVAGIGIAGFFTSANGAGVSGVVANANNYGVYAGNDAATSGTGAALRANGKLNSGVVATSSNRDAIRGQATGCTGFLCGSNGVHGTGYGFAAGVSGDGGLFGVYGSSFIGVYGFSGETNGIGVEGVTDYTGVGGYGANSLGSNSCGNGESWSCAGGDFSGTNGVVGVSGSSFLGAGVLGSDGGGANYALWSNGSTLVDGDLVVTGTCTGCAAATLAVATESLAQGDAVAIAGVTEVNGQVALQVRKANKNDTVVGVMDRAFIVGSGTTTSVPRRQVELMKGVMAELPGNHLTSAQGKGVLWLGDATAAKGSLVRVVVSGIVTFASADASGGSIAVGDSLAASSNAGKLSKSDGTATGKSIGYAVGTLSNGRIAVYIQPH